MLSDVVQIRLDDLDGAGKSKNKCIWQRIKYLQVILLRH